MNPIIHVYQKPAQGNSFIRRFPAYNYRHRIAAIGGFDTASCDIAVTVPQGEQMLEQYIGNRVAVFMDNPIEPIWEGFINRITFEYGGVIFTISLDEVANKSRITWSQTGISGGVTQLSGPVSNTDSQAIYGIKDALFDAQVSDSTSSDTGHKEAIRDRVLNLQAWPKPSTSLTSGSGLPVIRLEMLGFYHTLGWDICSRTAAAAAAPDDEIKAVLAAGGQLSNQDTFFDNSDVSLIESNSAFVFPVGARQGMTVWEYFQGVVEAGDGANRWVMGLTPTDPNSDTRRFYYRQASATVAYTTRIRQPGQIYTVNGRRVNPWDVQPDRGIRLSDALIGWSLPGDDPREFYIEVVDYDAERGDVQLRSSDDITFEGSFQTRQFVRRHGRKYGQAPRNKR